MGHDYLISDVYRPQGTSPDHRRLQMTSSIITTVKATTMPNCPALLVTVSLSGLGVPGSVSAVRRLTGKGPPGAEVGRRPPSNVPWWASAPGCLQRRSPVAMGKQCRSSPLRLRRSGHRAKLAALDVNDPSCTQKANQLASSGSDTAATQLQKVTSNGELMAAFGKAAECRGLFGIATH